MTPVHLSRFSIHSNKILHLSKPTNSFLTLALKVKSVAVIIIPLIAVVFTYIILSSPYENDLAKSKEISFDSLKFSGDDKKNIKFIIENLATKKKSELLKMSSELSSCGNKIKDIHPLKFMSYVLSDKKIKNEHIPLILKDMFKKMSFMKGLTKSLEQTNNNNLLEPCLTDFMKSVSISLSKRDELASLIEKRKWNDFFNFALQNSNSSFSLF